VAISLRRRAVPRPSPNAMTLVEHLGELRQRLIKSLIAFVAMAIVAYVFYPHLLRFLEHPWCAAMDKHSCSLAVLSPLDPFALRLNVSAYGGLVLASPIILFQAWQFVTPGLKASEKRYAIPFVLCAIGLFCLGAYVAWLTFPHALGFLHAAGGPGINDLFTAQRYINLILALMAIFGLTFEFPIVLVALELAGVVTWRQLVKVRRWAILGITIIAAVVTPSSDPFSMLAMAIPMVIFYEISIIIGRFLRR
jgi:sec-independent protein translocase protein TatC